MYTNSGSKLDLAGFSDSDYAGDKNIRRLTTGYLFELTQRPITWGSKRHSTISLSTTEAEFIAASKATREAIWLRKLLSDIGHPCKMPSPLYADSQSAIRLTKNPEFHQLTKHINVQHHFIKEKYESGEIDLDYIRSKDQKTDLLTKLIAYDHFQKLRQNINVTDVPKTLNQWEC